MAPGPQLKLNDPIVVDGTKYRIKGVGIASLHLYDRFAVIGRRDLYIDIARITGWDRVAGVWRVAPCEAAAQRMRERNAARQVETVESID